jgi:hypothetical protein
MKNSDYADDQVPSWRYYVDKFLLLNWKKALIIAGVWVLLVVLHKGMYGPFSDYFGLNGGPAGYEVDPIRCPG